MATKDSLRKYKWIKKAYKQYTVSLRHDADQELIDMIEEMKSKGMTNQDVFRAALKLLKEKK